MKPQLAAALFALAVAACGQTTAVESAPAAEEPPAPVAQSTGGACRTVPALTDLLGMESQGAIGAYTIVATPGAVACSEPALDSVECAFTGPAEARVASSETSFTNYVLDAGQSGTLTVGLNGPSCYLNANGG
jgi:hypothetical protein